MAENQIWRMPYNKQQLQEAVENQFPVIGNNGNWWLWDIDNSERVDSGSIATGKSPYIGNNGNWYVWDTSTEDYVDSGVTAATSLANGSVTFAKLATDATTKVASVTLTAAGWAYASGEYTQTVTVSGQTITASTKADLQPAASVINQLLADEVSALFIVNNNGTLIAHAIGGAPSENLTVQITLTEVTV